MTQEDLRPLIERLNEIYKLLTGSPDPEQEEDAQKELTTLLGEIKEKLSDNEELRTRAEELKEMVENWDTLEKWFKEVEGLSEKMGDFIAQFITEQTEQEESESTKDSSSSPLQMPTLAKDATAAEIEEYKRKMEELQRKMKELEEKERLLREKEEKLKKLEALEAQKRLQASTRETGHLKSKLPTPKIELPKVSTPKKKITPSTLQKEEKEEEKEEKIPKVKIPTPVQPKIKVNPIKIKIKPTTAPASTSSSSGFAPKIRPVGAPIKPAAANTPKPVIKPVGANTPKPVIKPVGANTPKPVIKPVGANTPKPVIKPVGANTPKPVIKPVGANSPKPVIKPVSSNSPRPAIKPVSSAPPKVTPIGQTPGNQSPNAAAQKPNIPSIGKGIGAKPLNLFSKQKGPVNLFSKKSTAPKNLFKKNSTSPSTPQPTSPGGPIPVAKVGAVKPVKLTPVQKVQGLQKINFAAQAPKIKQEEDNYSKMPPDELYHELIKLEAKQYYYDLCLKEIEKRHKEGKIPEAEFRGESEKYNFQIKNLNNKIKKIRSIILGI